MTFILYILCSRHDSEDFPSMNLFNGAVIMVNDAQNIAQMRSRSLEGDGCKDQMVRVAMARRLEWRSGCLVQQ